MDVCVCEREGRERGREGEEEKGGRERNWMCVRGEEREEVRM